MKLADDQDSVLYTSTYIRRQVIAHFLGSYDMYKDRVSDFVCNEYGRIDSQEGPFSLKSWCEHYTEGQDLLRCYGYRTLGICIWVQNKLLLEVTI